MPLPVFNLYLHVVRTESEHCINSIYIINILGRGASTRHAGPPLHQVCQRRRLGRQEARPGPAGRPHEVHLPRIREPLRGQQRSPAALAREGLRGGGRRLHRQGPHRSQKGVGAAVPQHCAAGACRPQLRTPVNTVIRLTRQLRAACADEVKERRLLPLPQYCIRGAIMMPHSRPLHL